MKHSGRPPHAIRLARRDWNDCAARLHQMIVWNRPPQIDAGSNDRAHPDHNAGQYHASSSDCRAVHNLRRHDIARQQASNIKAVRSDARPGIVAEDNPRPDEHVISDPCARMELRALSDLAAITDMSSVHDRAGRDDTVFTQDRTTDHAGKLPHLHAWADMGTLDVRLGMNNGAITMCGHVIIFHKVPSTNSVSENWE